MPTYNSPSFQRRYNFQFAFALPYSSSNRYCFPFSQKFTCLRSGQQITITVDLIEATWHLLLTLHQLKRWYSKWCTWEKNSTKIEWTNIFHYCLWRNISDFCYTVWSIARSFYIHICSFKKIVNFCRTSLAAQTNTTVSIIAAMLKSPQLHSNNSIFNLILYFMHLSLWCTHNLYTYV